MAGVVNQRKGGETVPRMHDSGLGSFGSETDSSPCGGGGSTLAGPMTDDRALPRLDFSRCRDVSFHAVYFGEATLDRRHTPAMLPWLIAGIRRRGKGRPVKLVVGDSILSAFLTNNMSPVHDLTSGHLKSAHMTTLFCHRLNTMTRFARTVHSPACFSYLIRSNSDSPFVCHVFHATNETMVEALFDAVRHAVAKCPKAMSDLPGSATNLYEVLYIGKVVVSTKKAPPSFIDDAVAKFDEVTRQACIGKKTAAGRRQRLESDASIHSLPADLERVVSIHENELPTQMCSKAGLRASVDSTLSSVSDDAFFGTNTSATQNVDAAQTSSTDADVSCSSRESLYEGSDLRRTHGQAERQKVLPCSGADLQRSAMQQRSRATSSDSAEHRNRTMLIQVGLNELSLISLDRKTVIFERHFKDISFCSQGIVNPEHFGFISRDPESGNFTCYVFRCAAESVVAEVMLTLKQAFQSAFQQNTSKNLIVCELCPLHQFHKFCQFVDNMSASQLHETLKQRILQLSDQDQIEILSNIESSDTLDWWEQDWNEVMMSRLLKLSETKQHEHVHLGDVGRSTHGKYDFVLNDPPKGKLSKFDGFCNFARKSFGSSFEHLFKAAKEQSGIQLEQSWTATSLDASLNASKLGAVSLSPLSPSVDHESIRLFSPTRRLSESDVEFRQRPHSMPHRMTHIRESPSSEDVKDSAQLPEVVQAAGTDIPPNSPIRSMFAKVGNTATGAGSARTSRHLHSDDAAGQNEMTSRALDGANGSWRLSLLRSVMGDSICETGASLGRSLASLKTPMPAKKMRLLWQKAILETMMLIQMNRETQPSVTANKSQQRSAAVTEAACPLMVLEYEELTPCLKEVTKIWEQMINTPDRTTTKFDSDVLTDAVRQGVPRERRGQIWLLLVEQHRLRHKVDEWSATEVEGSEKYDDLLKRLTLHQHAILIDLGRTFPSHPYFSIQLGPGQLSLFNLLKAYSLLDEEVGYCQGLSFIAGILLMHISERKAFSVMEYMMFNLGFRHQYRPDMVTLQVQMYQLSRLLHDHHKDLYDYFEINDVAPTLYAAPWFLTIFASQFPIGFVARVFDLIFLQGKEVVLKMALVLLGNHKELIKQCIGFESIVEFLKTTLPEMGIIQLERVINEVFAMDISKQLEAYEVEYHVLQEEMSAVHRSQKGRGGVGLSLPNDTTNHLTRLQIENEALRRQKTELLDQLQMARRQSRALEEQNQGLVAVERKLRSYIQVLELERTAFLSTITSLRQLISKNSSTDPSTDAADGIPLADIDQEVASLLEVHDQAASVVDNMTLNLPVVQNSSVPATVRGRPSSANC